MKDYDDLKNEELDIIIREGLRSEFWKWYSHNFEESQKKLIDQVVSLRLTGWDDLVKIVNLLASYKSREEYMNWPLNVLKAIEIERENNKNLGLTPNDR